jgi:ribosome-associated toxin RatA of RatAB toxin-antitoxin module
MSIDKVRQSTVVAADLDRVMAVIRDLEAYPEWQAGIEEVVVLETGEDGRARSARFVVNAKGFTVAFTLTYEYTPTEMRWRLVDSDFLARNDGAYLLAEWDDGATEVTYEMEVETTISIPGFLRKQIANRVVENALEGLRSRLDG